VRIFAIIVVIAAAFGWWFHDQRSKKEQAAQAAQASAKAVTAAGFQPYAGKAGAPRKAQVTGMRLITPAPEFQQQVATATLDLFIRDVEQQSADVLRTAKAGTVRIHFTTGLKYQTVQVQAQGLDRSQLQALHARMMSLERLKVKSSDVAFELQLTVAP
jgi:hypothetical protein